MAADNVETIKCPSCKNEVSITYTFCPYCGYDLRPLIKLKARKEINIKWILLNRIRYLLIKPDKVFREIALTPDLIGPFMIFILSALFVALKYPILSPPSGTNMTFFSLIFIASLAEVFLINIFIVAIIHIVVRLLGGIGNFSTTLSIFGYSYLPVALGFLVIDIQLLFIPKKTINLDNILLIGNLFNPSATIFAFFMLISAFYFAFGLAYAHGFDKIFSFVVSYISYGLIIAVLLA
ncbi:MAG: YIP1 family protein [Candidatus Njordarchaeia archaeon]